MGGGKFVRVEYTNPPPRPVSFIFTKNRRPGFFRRNVETIVSFLTLSAVLTSFYIIAPIAIEREARRQEIVQQVNCEQYGESMNAWAAERGLEKPCQL
jgi:hypothetical protein